MYRKQKLTVILPCRNEGSHLAKVIKKIPKVVDEIIVVSNKSTDNTVEVAKKLGVKVIEDNRTLGGIGYGYAHMSGIKAATGDLIIGIDGDATYPIEEIKSIVDHLLENDIDFVSCSRYPLKDDTKIPFKLRFGVWLLNVEVLLLYGKRVNDILSGMWVFKKSIRSKLHLSMGDWNLSPQIKLNAATHPAITFQEFHIVQHRREGETKQNYLATGLSHMLWIAGNRFRIIAFLLDEAHRYIYRFLIVGVGAFLFNYALLYTFSGVFRLEKILGEVLAMIVSLQLTFIAHDKWTYPSSSSKQYSHTLLSRYIGYLASNSFGSIITIGLFALFSTLTGNFTALAVSALIAMVWNFCMNRFVIWRWKTRSLRLRKTK